jgi:hypothetical protein
MILYDFQEASSNPQSSEADTVQLKLLLENNSTHMHTCMFKALIEGVNQLPNIWFDYPDAFKSVAKFPWV